MEKTKINLNVLEDISQDIKEIRKDIKNADFTTEDIKDIRTALEELAAEAKKVKEFFAKRSKA